VAEKSTWLEFTDLERRALREHGPLEYQTAYGRALQHHALPYPDIAT
jgi:hypothetical protein